MKIHTGRSHACYTQHCFGKAHLQLFIYQSVWRLNQGKLNLSLDIQTYTQEIDRESENIPPLMDNIMENIPPQMEEYFLNGEDIVLD